MLLPFVWIFKVYYVGVGGWNRYAENIIKYVGNKLPLGIISERCDTIDNRNRSKIMCLEPYIKLYGMSKYAKLLNY